MQRVVTLNVVWRLLLIVCAASPAYSAALQSTGLPDGEPENVLPVGAVAHIRIANPMRLLETVEAAAVSFVPERALPPQLQPAFQNPRPILSLLGAQLTGQTLNADGIARLSGIDATRSIALTFYPIDNGVVLSIPFADGGIFSGFLTSVSRAVRFDRVDRFGTAMYVVQTAHPDFPRQRHIVCSSTAHTFACRPISHPPSRPPVRRRSKTIRSSNRHWPPSRPRILSPLRGRVN